MFPSTRLEGEQLFTNKVQQKSNRHPPGPLQRDMYGSRSRRYLGQVENGSFRSDFYVNFHNKATRLWSGAKVN